ncbi:MAG: TIGR04283 family arsenosugar biosynthesis glycosyltransferase [Arenicellales bacterium]
MRNPGIQVSVVVPVYNEEELVPDLVPYLASLDAPEIIVVDGGSGDGTWQRLNDLNPGKLLCLRAPRGRAAQMNSGAVRAGGDLLMFLHADTRLPPHWLSSAKTALARNPECRWGRFDVRFDRAGPMLRRVALAMNLRSSMTSICTGDQAIFVYRDDFLAIGGFAPVPLMEDIDLSRRLRRHSLALRVRAPATTSSRRWLTQGTLRTIVSMWRLRWLYWWGVPASALAQRYYKRHR